MWKSGDRLTVSMPMTWRFIRGRMIQEGRVALMRGPVLFSFSEKLNAEVLKKCPEPRDLVLDPASIGDPVLDDAVRPNGQKVVVKAWTNSECTGDPIDVVLTEFIDPNGTEVYFKIPNLSDAKPIRVVDDELFSDPRRSANGEITMAWYGPKSDGSWKDLLAVKGELVADLAADYVNPQGKQNVPATFPDKSKSGSWSLFNCKADALTPAAKASDTKPLSSSFKVEGCPLGYAYGLEGGENLGFFADYVPAKNMEENWGRHFSRDMFDRILPADRRRQFLITHPISNVDNYNLIRWTPSSQLSGKSIGIAGNLFSNPGGNGVSLKLVNWKDEHTPVAQDVLYLKQGSKGTNAIESEFVVHIKPGDLESMSTLLSATTGAMSAMRPRCGSAFTRPTSGTKCKVWTSPRKCKRCFRASSGPTWESTRTYSEIRLPAKRRR